MKYTHLVRDLRIDPRMLCGLERVKGRPLLDVRAARDPYFTRDVDLCPECERVARCGRLLDDAR